jgi:hypothetical protein
VEQRIEYIYGQEGACEVGQNSWLVSAWSFPLAGLYIYRDELALSMAFERYQLPRDKIVRIYRYQRLFTTGLRIHHRVEDYPPLMIFYPLNLE